MAAAIIKTDNILSYLITAILELGSIGYFWPKVKLIPTAAAGNGVPGSVVRLTIDAKPPQKTRVALAEMVGIMRPDSDS